MNFEKLYMKFVEWIFRNYIEICWMNFEKLYWNLLKNLLIKMINNDLKIDADGMDFSPATIDIIYAI